MWRPQPSRLQKLAWRLEAAAFDGLVGLVRLVPIDVASWAGGWLLRLIGPLTGAHKTARDNLLLAFPDLSERELRRLLAAQWENNGRLLAEFPLMDRITPASGRVEVVNRQRFLDIAAAKTPTVFVSGHLSNFEVMASAIMDGGVVCQVTYRATNNPYVDQRIRDGRRAYGVRLLAPKGESARELIEALRAGETIAIMNDQKFNTGILVDFFGHPAHTAPGPTRLAIGSGAALQPLSVQRTRGARFQVIVHDPIVLKSTGDRSADIADGVRQITAFIEARIRERPQEWFWVHKRWPSEVYAQLHERRAPVEKARRRARGRIRLIAALVLLAALVGAGLNLWIDDIRRAALDPRTPFQVLVPPPAPDYGQPAAWALMPSGAPGGPGADVFFVHPTTYDGGEGWNAAIDDPRAARQLETVMLPNYARPFAAAGRLLAPRYRQASLYSMLRANREDARDARQLAYADVRAAFRLYLAAHDQRRPLILAGVEQGGSIVARLLAEELTDPRVRRRLVAAYLIETPVPARDHAPGAAAPACRARDQTGCVLAWVSAASPIDLAEFENRRALVWTQAGGLDYLAARPALCVNPILGEATEAPARAEAGKGAANATGRAMGEAPSLIQGKVAAHCERGVLRLNVRGDRALRPARGWADRQKASPFNLFYGDLEADAKTRLAAWMQANAAAAP